MMLKKKDIIKGMEEVVKILENYELSKNFYKLMPEVRINIVYALPKAKSREDVLGFNGRITYIVDKEEKKVPAHYGLRWGSSDHMARAVINVRKYRPEINAGMNFRADESMIRHVESFCEENGFSYGLVDREHEPEISSRIDGQSMPWKMKYLHEIYGKIPDFFYENPAPGKEPLYYAVSIEPMGLLKIVLKIADEYNP
jgi:hydroxymethylpyrimidine/phosphomethylpyrimidine kinase